MQMRGPSKNCTCQPLPLGYGFCPSCQQWQKLPKLRQAIIDNTNSEDMFWIGEFLLAELERETGFKG